MGERLPPSSAEANLEALNSFYADCLKRYEFSKGWTPLLHPGPTIDLFNSWADHLLWSGEPPEVGLGPSVGIYEVPRISMYGIYGRDEITRGAAALTELGGLFWELLSKHPEYKFFLVHGGAMQAGGDRPDERRKFPNIASKHSLTSTIVQQIQADIFPVIKGATEDHGHYEPPDSDVDICVICSKPGATLEELCLQLQDLMPDDLRSKIRIVVSERQPGFRRIDILNRSGIVLGHIVPPTDCFGNYNRMDLSIGHFIMAEGSVPGIVDLLPDPKEKVIHGLLWKFFEFDVPKIKFYQKAFPQKGSAQTDEEALIDSLIERYVFYPWPEISFPVETCFPEAFYRVLYGLRGKWPFGYMPVIGNPEDIISEESADKILQLSYETAAWFYKNIFEKVKDNPELLGREEQRRANAERVRKALFAALTVNPYPTAVRFFLRLREIDKSNPLRTPYFGMGIAECLMPELEKFLRKKSIFLKRPRRSRTEKLLEGMQHDSGWQKAVSHNCRDCRLDRAGMPGQIYERFHLYGEGDLDFTRFLLAELRLPKNFLSKMSKSGFRRYDKLFRVSFQ